MLCWIFLNIRRINSCFRYEFGMIFPGKNVFQILSRSSLSLSVDRKTQVFQYRRNIFFSTKRCEVIKNYILFRTFFIVSFLLNSLITSFIGKMAVGIDHLWILISRNIHLKKICTLYATTLATFLDLMITM